jgi:hypothetical protein
VGTTLPLHHCMEGLQREPKRHGELDADLRTLALIGTPSFTSLHDYYPFALEDRGELAPMTVELVDRLATLVHRFSGMGRCCGLPLIALGYAEGGSSSWAVTRPTTNIGLSGFRTRELSRDRRALYRHTGKERMCLSGFSPLSFNHDITTPPSRTLPGPQPGSEANVEGGSSSWAVTRPTTKIGLTGFRTCDLSRDMRALYRHTTKELMSLNGFSPLSSNHDI